MPLRLTQLPVEVGRGEMAGQARLSQLVVEVLVPFVLAGPHRLKSASAALVLHAACDRHRTPVPKSASSSLVLTATCSTRGTGHRVAASLALTLTATTIRVKRGIASVRLVLAAATPHPPGARKVAASARLVLKARVFTSFPSIEFGDDYLGRFQLGLEVPLLVVVRDKDGQPADPTTVPPEARVYDLDARLSVEAVELSHLRGARADQVYARRLGLGRPYGAGRYGVLYRATTGGFSGVHLAIFEVVPGGDPAGPVLALRSLGRPAGDVVMVQLGSGAVALGEGPSVS